MLKRTIIIISLGMLMYYTQLAFAEDVVSPRAVVDAQADKTLRQMGAYLAKAKKFSFESHKMVDFVLESGQKIQLSDTTSIMVSRPGKIRAHTTGDTRNDQVWYNGTKLAFFNNEQNAYAIINVPNNIDAMMDYMAENYGFTVPIADLLFSDPYKTAMENVRQGQYVGLHQVQNVNCHHLAFRQEGLDWQLWIEEGDKPLPRKLVITYKELPGHPQFIAFLGKWNLSPKFPDDLFIFKAPEGAEKVDLKPISDTTTTDQTPSEKSKPQSPQDK